VQNCRWIEAARLFDPGLLDLLKGLNETLPARAHAKLPRRKGTKGCLGVLCGLACKKIRGGIMTLAPISFDELLVRSHYLWNKQRLLLTAGDFAAGRFNTMTVGWGSLGTMWGRPFAQVVVRPVRYTFQFTEQYDTFTLCVLPASLQPAWQLLGSKSGRDGDKIAESGLTPAASTRVAAPSFAEAELVIECRKIYWDDIVPRHFLDPAIDQHYPNKDYHRIYFGEILEIHGHEQYKRAA